MPRVPTDLGGLLQVLTDIVVDPFNDGWAFADQPGGPKRYGARLPKLLPDLRGGKARRIAVSDATPVAAFSRSPVPGENFEPR